MKKQDTRPEHHVCDPRYPGRTLAIAPKPKKVKQQKGRSK